MFKNGPINAIPMNAHYSMRRWCLQSKFEESTSDMYIGICMKRNPNLKYQIHQNL